MKYKCLTSANDVIAVHEDEDGKHFTQRVLLFAVSTDKDGYELISPMVYDDFFHAVDEVPSFRFLCHKDELGVYLENWDSCWKQKK